MDEAQHREFVKRATAFLEANAGRRPIKSDTFVWGEGEDDIRLLGSADPEHEDQRMAEAAAWRAKAFDAGFAWAGGAKAHGGGGLDPELNDVWREVEGDFLVPDQGHYGVSWDMVGPAVEVHGSDDLKRRFLGPIYRGDLLCSQLLSEPEAGSDLAGLKTRAVRDGDEWIVNGQKVWNSYAHKAKIGQLMARTDPDAPKHQGLTMFLLPMDTPGVEVRPLKQMTGDAEFNEVFLTDVRIPDANRVGEPGSGWRAVLTTLMSERASVGANKASQGASPARMVTELARHLGRTSDPVIRQKLAEVHVVDFLIRNVAARAEAEREKSGAERGAEGSILKLLGSRQNCRIGDLAGELLGPAFTADTGEWGTYNWSRYRCAAPALRIAGGTDEIQHNILGERILGLPRE
ncbi:MAG: acyl-CoA dehydrogenase family protein [Ilumatobacteraceae bacterium]